MEQVTIEGIGVLRVRNTKKWNFPMRLTEGGCSRMELELVYNQMAEGPREFRADPKNPDDFEFMIIDGRDGTVMQSRQPIQVFKGLDRATVEIPCEIQCDLPKNGSVLWIGLFFPEPRRIGSSIIHQVANCIRSATE